MTETEVAAEALTVDVYPNPALPGGDVTVQVSGALEPVSVSLIDLMGQSKYETRVGAEDAARGFTITEQKPLRKGIYIIVIRQGEQSARRLLVVKQ